MVLILDEVLIFQGGCVMGPTLDVPAKQTAFKVVYTRDIILVIKPESVSHEYQVNLFVAFHLDRVDTIDARNERGWVFL